ncbi:MAG: hypothetical protein K6G27_07415 [Lachnospiraceae bacterium]|nr:hypothetical protein [Lachnospiraceae bacterium]
MGILNIFKKNKKSDMEDELSRLESNLLPDEGIVGEVEHGGPKEEKEEKEDKELTTGTGSCSFVMGVTDYAPIEGTDNIVVTGNLKGSVDTGISLAVINYGDDKKEMLMTSVIGLDVNGESVEHASDCFAGLILEGASDIDIRIGTVLYTRDMGSDSIHDAYVAALSEGYVKERALEMSDEEINRLSLTDCSEIWRLNTWYMAHEGQDEDDGLKKAREERLNKIVLSLRDKILDAEEIYYVHDKRTGEAHLYSQTFEKGDGSYLCTNPNILIISKAYRRRYKKTYNTDTTELAIVRNGKDKKGIHNFLQGNFYINGACGVAVNAVQVSVAAGMLVDKPVYDGVPVENIPVTNPGLVRWMLLLGQLGSPKEDAEEAVAFRLYFSFLGRELRRARLIIPVKHQGEDEEDRENEGLDVAKMKGKNSKDALIMYTDWRRLRSEYGKNWDGMVHRVGGIIGKFDCALNPTKYPSAGMYLTEDMYKSMVEMSKKAKV